MSYMREIVDLLQHWITKRMIFDTARAPNQNKLRVCFVSVANLEPTGSVVLRRRFRTSVAGGDLSQGLGVASWR